MTKLRDLVKDMNTLPIAKVEQICKEMNLSFECEDGKIGRLRK